MAKFLVVKDANITSTIEVEAEDAQEAIDKVQDAWSSSLEFVQNYLNTAEIVDEDTYGTEFARETMTLDEVCRQ